MHRRLQSGSSGRAGRNTGDGWSRSRGSRQRKKSPPGPRLVLRGSRWHITGTYLGIRLRKSTLEHVILPP